MTTDALAAVDELHIGGRAATRHLAGALDPQPGMRVLDIGSGLGGAARYLAEQFDVHVTGLDLDAGYCALASMLSERAGLDHWTVFEAGDALDPPYRDGAFDAAYTLHTAMSIADKGRLYRGINRVLKPGGLFVLYDVLAGENPVAPSYPLPWSAEAGYSFLVTQAELDRVLEGSGFDVTARDDRTGFAKEALRRALDSGKTGAIGLVHGGDAGRRIANLSMAIDDSRCAVWQYTCRRRR